MHFQKPESQNDIISISFILCRLDIKLDIISEYHSYDSRDTAHSTPQKHHRCSAAGPVTMLLALQYAGGGPSAQLHCAGRSGPRSSSSDAESPRTLPDGSTGASSMPAK